MNLVHACCLWKRKKCLKEIYESLQQKHFRLFLSCFMETLDGDTVFDVSNEEVNYDKVGGSTFETTAFKDYLDNVAAVVKERIAVEPELSDLEHRFYNFQTYSIDDKDDVYDITNSYEDYITSVADISSKPSYESHTMQVSGSQMMKSFIQ